MIHLKGYVVLEAHDKNGLLVARRETHNLWTTLGQAFVANTLMATAGYSVGMSFCALGIGAIAPALTDTILNSEASRLAVSTRTVTGTTLAITTIFLAANCTFFIKEIGLFGHSSATATTNTGILFARTLLSYDNSVSASNLTCVWTILVG